MYLLYKDCRLMSSLVVYVTAGLWSRTVKLSLLIVEPVLGHRIFSLAHRVLVTGSRNVSSVA